MTDRTTKPEFSPDMLRLFLRARCLHAVSSGVICDIKAARAALRKRAGVTAAAFDVAWAGRLHKAQTRLKLWGALGLVPADHGIVLSDDGGQS
ncbi:hypothetical protein [Hoeflea sp.]|uniref:hypothetical protein n=1 Tax=Hoeflea sp. TaxID=1940281 RepID=UPI002AFE202F|nr:hypothetical protein [Hoeflea sp.]